MSKLSIHTRLVVMVLILCAFSLAATGLTIFALTKQQQTAWINSRLESEATSFVVLASEGTDPDTGEPFSSPDPLIRAALEHTAFAENESAFGIVNDRISWVAPEGVQLRPEEDRELLKAALELATKEVTSYAVLDVGKHEYHYVVVPAIFDETQERGALVRVIDGNFIDSNDIPYSTYYWVAAAVMAIAGCITWLAANRFLQPITWVRSTAERISERDLSERIPVRGNDELAALTVTVNSMLDRLERAMAANHQLLDDASHELRTPLTILRGHLELLDPNDAEDVAATRELLLSEVDRMRELVNDLLMLGRAERTDFVSRTPTDVAHLTYETFDKARALGDRDWKLESVTSETANLDEQRIQQAWLQLASNAVKYSNPGTAVTLGSKLSAGRLLLWVSDEGIGIEPEERELILSRFGRTAAARAHNPEGFGLGLVIVESIARAHNGTLEIASNVPKAGSTFTISIPVQVFDSGPLEQSGE